MTDFTTHTPATAPAASKPLLEGAQAAYGFVPNLLGTMAEAPAMLEGYMTLAGIFDKSELSETERQIILMTNNRLNGCTYCMAAHTSLSQMAKVPADVIEALRAGTEIADAKLEALRQFAITINETRGWPSENAVSAFLDAGYSRQTILEVILGTALKVMSNYTNHVAETEVDQAFAANVWSNPANQAA
ncbi:carboxymuconolactone decarboxylase family protein [Hoeflea prorocentri]|uniref:Carboxymuconolactone decarboxylase family protein n=1 Tax=Hoeflea prorocentri TaxID=1922333 RepID=A0A9X3UKR4_9HYPH|nr:carboxymuconolactone decarboxylase family protein [Hoeflea prorocentri]MCY6382630.1 carboxymuconolactone decarboxylase family protein [Hoeflea prorocentri]MDA5400430.1 carboxymuconolactone decarboxylase family protein [Hoeflea prorocentri]